MTWCKKKMSKTTPFTYLIANSISYLKPFSPKRKYGQTWRLVKKWRESKQKHRNRNFYKSKKCGLKLLETRGPQKYSFLAVMSRIHHNIVNSCITCQDGHQNIIDRYWRSRTREDSRQSNKPFYTDPNTMLFSQKYFYAKKFFRWQ
jgi:hypothetical protein